MWHRRGGAVNAEPLIDANEASRVLKIYPVTVREMSARGELPGFKIGKV
jgi:hypothetical protein